MKNTLLLLFLTLNVSMANAQYSFEEIPTTNANSSSGDGNKKPISFQNKLYFSGAVNYNDGGSELFRYDDTTVSLFADINVPGHSYPADLYNVNDDYFLFTAYNDASGRELYASDGLSTWQVKDIQPGTESGMENGGNDYFQYVVLNNKVYFFAREDGNGFDLWRTDGTSAGTEKVAELNEFNLGIKGFIIVFNNEIYFTMSVGGESEMYKYEDVTNSVTKVFEVNMSGSSTPSQYSIINNHLFFVANNVTNEREWYYTDGIASPTMINLNETLSTNPNQTIVYDDKIYFVGAVGVSNIRNPYTVFYNPVSTNFETTLLKNFTQSSLNGTVIGANGFFIPFNESVYFAARESGIDNNLWQLYKTDGTAAGTEKAVNITTTHTGGLSENELKSMIVYNGKLFFEMSATPFGDAQLWVTDGTLSNLSRLTDDGASKMRKAYLKNAIINNNTLIVRGFSSINAFDYELWKITNGTLHTSETESMTISLYPNPANEKVFWKSSEKIQTLIFDISGKMVLKSFDHPIDTSKLPIGTYIVKGQTSSGKIVARKLIVQH